MSLELKELIEQFLKQSEADPEFELYNEAGLQHELALFLRKQFERTRYRTQLERNVDDIGISLGEDEFPKREIDIYIYERGGNERYCIELKFPTRGAFPRRMYQTFEDVNFIEYLKYKASFSGVALLFMTPLGGFLEGRDNAGIYKYFREDKCIRQPDYNLLQEFLQNKEKYKPLNIQGQYKFGWAKFRAKYHYFVITF